MFVHVVMFSWRSGTTDQEIEAATVALKRLCESTSGLVEFEMGRDSGLTSGRFGAEMGLTSEKADFCVVMKFDSADSWHEYNADPEHRAVVRESVGKLLARRISVQFKI